MIYQGAGIEQAKRLYIFAVCLVLVTFAVQAVGIQQAYAMPALPIEEFEQLAPQFEVIEGGLEAITATGHPEAAIAIMAAIGGIYLSTKTRGYLPRIMDIWLATNPNITEQEEKEIKKAIWKLDRDGYIYMANLTYWIRKPIFELAQEIRKAIAEKGKFTIDDYVIEEEDLINPVPGEWQDYIVAAPKGGITTWTFHGTNGGPEIQHPPNGLTSDMDGSYVNKLDYFRLHQYMYTLRMDHFENSNDMVMDFTNWKTNVFGDYWDGKSFSISLSDEGVYFNSELIFRAEDLAYPMPVRFTGHTDIKISTNASKVHVQSGFPDIVEVTPADVLETGAEWALERQQEITAPEIDPASDLGQSMVVIPEADPEEWVVGEISPESDSVIQPIPESMPRPIPVPEPYPGGGLGDLPVTIPDTVDGSKIPKVRNYESLKERFPFSLPWDIQRIFDRFNKYASEPPKFEVNFGSFIVDSSSHKREQTFEINLDWMQEYIPFIHVMELIVADLMLIMWILRHYVAG